MKQGILRLASGVGLAGLMTVVASPVALANGGGDWDRHNQHQSNHHQSYHHANYNNNHHSRGAWHHGRWYNNSHEWVNAHRNWRSFQDNGRWISTAHWRDNDWDRWYQNYCDRHNRW